MEFSNKVEKDFVICTISGRLLINDEVEKILESLEESVEKYDIVIDMKDLDYVSSSGLSLFIRLLTKTRIREKKLVLVGMKDNVSQLFKITKLNNVFTTALTVANATKNQ